MKRTAGRTTVMGLALLGVTLHGCDAPPVHCEDAAVDAGTSHPSDAGALAPADAAGHSDQSAPPGAQPSGAPDTAEPGVSTAALRVANWSSDAPAVDFCLARHGSATFDGPLLRKHAQELAASGVDAGVAGVGFAEASGFFVLDPGQYDTRLVVAGAGDCSAKVGFDATLLPAVAAGDRLTVALMGQLHPVAMEAGLTMVGFRDDSTAAKGVALRWIHAAPSLPPLDLGTDTLATKFAPLFQGLSFGHASSSAPYDRNGYVSVDPILGATLSAHPSGASADTVVAENLNIAAGAVVTMIVLAPPPQSGRDPTLQGQLLQCVDNAGTLGIMGNCRVVSK